MNWTSIPNDERLRLWKDLRNEIKPKVLEQALSDVANFFAKMPFGTRTIDYYTPDSWPTPWEILYHGMFCTSSISVLMFYTIATSFPGIDIRMELIEDSFDVYLIPVVNNQFVLNYELGKISTYSEICNNFRVLQVFDSHQIRTLT